MGKGEGILVEKAGMATQNQPVREQGGERQGHGWRGRLPGQSPRPERWRPQRGHNSLPIWPVLIGTDSLCLGSVAPVPARGGSDLGNHRGESQQAPSLQLF